MNQINKYLPFLKVALPVSVGAIGVIIVNITDILFIASTGLNHELAAVAFISTFYLTIYHSIKGIASGGEVLIGRRNGEKKYPSIGKIVFYITVILGVLSTGTLLFITVFGELLLDFFIQDNYIFTSCIGYLLYRIFGLPFGLISEGILAFFNGIKETRIMGAFMVVKVIFNIIFNYGLILGNFGLPEMGIKGAAIASTLADFVGLLVLLLYLFLHEKLRNKYALFSIKNVEVDFQLFKRILNLSSPLVIQAFFAYGFYCLFFILIEKLGINASVQASLMIMIVEFAMIIRKPFSLITPSIVSNAIGEGATRKEVLQQVKDISRITTLFTLIIIVFLLMIRTPIIGLFAQNQIDFNQAVAIFNVALITALVATPSGIYYRAVVGMGATKYSMISASLSTLLCHGIIASVLLRLEFSFLWIWSVEILYWIILGIAVLVILHRKSDLIQRI